MHTWMVLRSFSTDTHPDLSLCTARGEGVVEFPTVLMLSFQGQAAGASRHPVSAKW